MVPPTTLGAFQTRPIVCLAGLPGRTSVEVDPLTQAQHATLSALPGLASLPLAERLARLPVEYQVKRRFRLWFMDPNKTVKPEKAADWVGNPRLLVKTSPEATPVPLSGTADLEKLEALHGQGTTASLAEPELGEQLKGLSARGLTFTVGGFPTDAYGAYNYLTTGWPSHEQQPASVTVRFQQVPVQRLDPGQVDLGQFEARLEKARAAAGDPVKVAQYLCGFYPRREEVVADLARFESGPESASFASLRRVLAHNDVSKVAAGLALTTRGELGDRLGLLEDVQYYRSYHSGYPDHGLLGKAFDGLIESGLSSGEARKTCADLSAVLAQNYNEGFNEVFQALGSLCPASPGRIGLFTTLVTRGSASDAQAVALKLAEPAGKLSESERIDLFGKIPGSLAGKNLSWELVQADLAAGKSVSEVLKRAQGLVQALGDRPAQAPADYAAAHPDRLDGVCSLLQAKVPPDGIGPLLDSIADHPERVGLLAALRERAPKAGPQFLKVLERDPRGLAQLEKLAGSVYKARLDNPGPFLDDWKNDPSRSELAAALVERGAGVSALHAIEGWAGPSSLAERLAALDALHAFNSNYGGLSAQHQGLSSALKAMGALLQSGASLQAAQGRMTDAQGILLQQYHYDQVPVAFGFMAEQAGNESALDCLQRMLNVTGEVEPSIQCARALTEPREGQAQRIQAAFKLGLEELRGESVRLALIDAVKGALAGGEDPACLTELVGAAKPLTQEAAAFALGYATDRPTERSRLVALLKAGFPAQVAGPTLDRSQGGSLEPLLGLGKAAQRLEDNQVKAFQAIERPDPTTLARLCQAFGQRPVLAAPLAELFDKELNGKGEEVEVLSRLHEKSRFSASETIELFRALAVPAGSTTLTERLEAFLGTGGLRDHYQGPGQNVRLAVKHAETLRAQLASGATLKEATTALTRLWDGLYQTYHTGEAGPALEHLAGLGQSPRRELFLKLVGEGYEVDSAAHASNLVAEPAGRTRIEERIQAFHDLQLANLSHPVRESQFRAYRFEVGAGQTSQAAVTKLQTLQQALGRWDESEVCTACDHVADHLTGTRPEFAALIEQLKAGVKPHVAVAALERARTSGDIGRLQALKGLGKAGHHLDVKVAQAFQEAQEKALASGVSAQTVDLTLARVTAAVGSRQLRGPEAAQVASIWGEKLAGKVESCEVFSLLLEAQQSPATALKLLELLQEPAGRTTLTERYQAFQELGGLSRHYHGDPGHTPEFALSMARALVAPLQNGAKLGEVKPQLASVWQTRSWNREGLQPVFAWLGELGAHPAERELLATLVSGQWEPDQAVAISRELHSDLGRTSFLERKQAFETLDLGQPQQYDRKQSLLKALRAEVEQGARIDRAASELKALTGGLSEDYACSAASAWSRELLGKPDLRKHFASLVGAGVPPRVALATVQNAPPDRLAAHSRLVGQLGGYGASLDTSTARGFTDTLDKHGHAEELELLARALAGRKLASDPGLQLYSEKLAGRPEAVRAYARLLELFPSDAGPLLTDLEATGGNYARRIETLNECGSFKQAHHQRLSWLPQVHQRLLHAGEQAGLPEAEVRQVITGNFQLEGWRLSGCAPLYECLLETPRDMVRWSGVFEDMLRHRHEPGDCRQVHQGLKDLPSEALELYAPFRASGLYPHQALQLLEAVKEPVGPTSLEDRRKALEQLCQASSTDGRSLMRRAWSGLAKLPDVSTGQLPTLAAIYRKLIELGQSSSQAADLVSNIYAAEQAKGVTVEELQKRLDNIAEVAKLEIRPDTGAAILRDEADKVVFSGVMVKKRRAPTS